jgi:hypothetical protein
MEQDPILKRLIKKSSHEIPDRNFEERVMEKILFAANHVRRNRKNIQLSWGFLGLSAGLLPVLLIYLSKSYFFSYLTRLGIDLSGISNILMPAAVLVAAIIILVQVDNLYRLTVQMR